MNKHITRKEALAVLYNLTGADILSEEITDDLEEIAYCISGESKGYHFWGADSDETTELAISKRQDLITDEWIAKRNAIADKYRFEPAKAERQDTEYNRKVEDDEE